MYLYWKGWKRGEEEEEHLDYHNKESIGVIHD